MRVPNPERTFLEMDELACLLDVAGAQEEVAKLGIEPRTPRFSEDHEIRGLVSDLRDFF